MILTVDHVDEENLLCYAYGTLEAGRIAAVDSHVSGCPDCVRRLQETATAAVHSRRNSQSGTVRKAERRSEPRIPTDQCGTLQVLQPLSLLREKVYIFDTSKNGLGLQLSDRLSLGCLVQVRIKDTVVLGEIRYCVKNGDTYRAGVQVEDIHVLRS